MSCFHLVNRVHMTMHTHKVCIFPYRFSFCNSSPSALACFLLLSSKYQKLVEGPENNSNQVDHFNFMSPNCSSYIKHLTYVDSLTHCQSCHFCHRQGLSVVVLSPTFPTASRTLICQCILLATVACEMQLG